MIVDFHTHWYPEVFLKRVVDLGRTDRANARTQSTDLTDRIVEMDQVGVDAQVLSFVGLNVEFPTAEPALESCRLLNDLYKDACERYPGRFLSFGKAPLPFMDVAIPETIRCLDELDCPGMALPCSFSGDVMLDDRRMEPFWAELDKRSAIAFIHPVGSDSHGHWSMRDWGMDALFGSPMQIGLAATRLVFSGVTRRYPKIRFLMAQGGGNMLPRWYPLERILSLGRSGHVPAFLAWTAKLDLDPTDLMRDFRNFYYDTVMMESPATLALCEETFGFERMVLGSDTAFGSLTKNIGHIRESDVLAAADKVALLETNSAALLQGHRLSARK